VGPFLEGIRQKLTEAIVRVALKEHVGNGADERTDEEEFEGGMDE
jgi:hypothetical protein